MTQEGCGKFAATLVVVVFFVVGLGLIALGVPPQTIFVYSIVGFLASVGVGIFFSSH
jgi:hypothetical protein